MVASESRIPPLPRDEWNDAARDIFAYWEGEPARETGSRSNTMMALASHPRLALATLDLGRYFMKESTLSAREQKIVVLRVAALTGSPYQWAHNSVTALRVGMTMDEVDAIRTGAADAVWNDGDRLLLETVDLVAAGGKIDDATWARLSASHDRRKIMDIIHAVGYFNMIAWFLIAARVQLEPDFVPASGHQAKAD